MKRVGIAGVVALCALPAHGHQQQLSIEVVHALTLIDSIPTRRELEKAFPSQDPGVQLSQIAKDSSVDFGIRLRAIRALPQFCPAAACDNSVPHDTLLALIGGVPPADHSGQAILLLRAAIEALGVARSGDPNDVAVLVPFLDYPSRDIRAATARALADLCDAGANAPLRRRSQSEAVDQVRLAISAALHVLERCSP